MIYLVHGPDRLLARDAVRAIAAEFDPGNVNSTWLDARETPLQTLISAIGSASFFGAPRVVIVSDLLARSAREAEGAAGGDGATERRGRGLPHLEPLFAAVPSDHCLILLEPALIAAPAAFKTAAPEAMIVACEPPRGPTLLAWIAETAGKAGSAIDRPTARLLAETLYPQTWDRKPSNPRYDRPPDLSLLTQELEKLALSAHPHPIAAAHVQALVPGGPDQRLFKFVDAALGGDLATAMAELDRLIAAGEEPAMLLAQVLGQIELAAVASTAGGRDATDISRRLGGVNPGRMSAVLSATRGERGRLALDAVARASAIDRALKTGRIRQPRDALQDLIATLAESGQRMQSGRSW